MAPQTISSDNSMVPGYMAATPTSPGMPYKAATPYQYPYNNTTQPQGFTQVNNTLSRIAITLTSALIIICTKPKLMKILESKINSDTTNH